MTTSPSSFAEFCISIADPSLGLRLHRELVPAVAADAKNLRTIEPWRETRTAAVLGLHPLAVWRTLAVNIVPGPGVFGRAVTLHFCWSHEGQTAPTTVAQMATFESYQVHTYGGAGDPGEANKVSKCPFNAAMSTVLKARNFIIGGRARFHFYYDQADFASKQVDGDRFQFVVSGDYEVFGRN